MSVGCESTDFVWLDPTLQVQDDSGVTSNFLKEGYLHVMEEKLPYKYDTSTLSRAMNLVRRLSDPTLLGSWSRRWCVLSQASDSFHLLLYKDESSFSNLHTPCGVLPLDKCLKLSSLPTHAKSDNTFAITLDKREILFYTDKSSDFEEWLQIFEEVLNLQDAYCHSPLKGLPRQKALRKDGHHKTSQIHSPNPNKVEAVPSYSHAPVSNKTTNCSHDITAAAAVVNGILAMPEASSVAGRRSKTFSGAGKNSQSLEPVKVLKVKQLGT